MRRPENIDIDPEFQNSLANRPNEGLASVIDNDSGPGDQPTHVGRVQKTRR